MTKNVGSADRAIRIGAAAVIVLLYLTHVISGPVAVILGIVAAVLLLTGFVGVCPAYMALKTSTLKR